MRDQVEFEWFDGPSEDILTRVEFHVPQYEDDPFEDLLVWIQVDGEWVRYHIDREEERQLQEEIWERWEPDIPDPPEPDMEEARRRGLL